MPSSQTSAIHSYHAPFTLLARHPNLFSLSSLSQYQSTSSAAYPMRDYSPPPYVDPLSNSEILHSLHMVEPLENTIIPFIQPFRRSVQLPYPCIRDFIYPLNTCQTSEVVHLYSPNTSPLLLLYHCLTTIHENRHEQ